METWLNDSMAFTRPPEPMHLYVGHPGSSLSWTDLGVVEDVEMTSFGPGGGTRYTVSAYQKPHPDPFGARYYEQREAEDLTQTEPGAAGW